MCIYRICKNNLCGTEVLETCHVNIKKVQNLVKAFKKIKNDACVYFESQFCQCDTLKAKIIGDINIAQT